MGSIVKTVRELINAFKTKESKITMKNIMKLLEEKKKRLGISGAKLVFIRHYYGWVELSNPKSSVGTFYFGSKEELIEWLKN